MLYHLSLYLKSYWSAINILHYVSFRAMAGLLTALGLSFVFGNWFINKFSQLVRTPTRAYVPDTHKLKGNVPTMGGLFIIANVLISALLWCNLLDLHVWVFLFTVLSFGAIGLIDDWNKLHKKQGISARAKFVLQLGSALLVVLSWLYLIGPSTELVLPFFKNIHPNLGYCFIPWAILVLVGCSNAVNLTDGLDGLAIGSLLPNFAVFGMIAYVSGHVLLAEYLQIPFMASSELAVLSAILVGSSLGFLWYNTYPAQFFMGDVGSLSLGAALALLGLMTKQELLLIIAGGLFVLETISVVLQVLSYKTTGKKIFKMAPIHHHFELLGWPESKITIRFTIISIVLSLLALMTLKMR